MRKDQERLLTLYKNNKISKEDYYILTEALKNKKTWSQKFFHIFINPFDRVAGYPSVGIGFTIVLLIGLTSQYSKIHFPGLFDLKVLGPEDGLASLSFRKILLQNMMISLTMACAFYLCARICKQHALRFVDFLGTTMMARFPYLVASLVFVALQLKGVNLHFNKVEDIDTYTLITITFTALFSIVWMGAAYFYCLKESSGLKGKPLWISFVCSLIVIETLTLYLNQQLT